MARTPNTHYEKLRAAAVRRHGDLYEWMFTHFRDFRAILARSQGGRIDWHALAAEFNAMGLKPGMKRPEYHAALVKSTWKRVCEVKDAKRLRIERTKKSEPIRDPKPGIIRALAETPHRVAPDPFEPGPKLFDRSKFKPAKLRNQTTVKDLDGQSNSSS